MVSVEDLVRHLHDTVPMTRHMGISAGANCTPNLVVLEAPLGPHINDKGTAFGGTLATLATLAGWAMANRLAGNPEGVVDVAVVSGSIEYRQPVRGARFSAACEKPCDTECRRFSNALEKFGKARIELEVVVAEGGIECVHYRGAYVART